MNETNRTAVARKTIDYGDWIITLALLGLMAMAYAMTRKWPSATAFFPELLSLAAIVFLLLKLGVLAWKAFGRTPAGGGAAQRKVHSNGDVALVTDVDEDQGNEDEFHKIFSQAGGRSWAGVIGWMILFFGGMYLFGLLAVLPVFTLLYLRLVAKASWLVCILYVLGTAGLIYLVFEMFLHLPLPQGIIPLFGE